MKKGVLLVNLGAPKSTKTEDVKTFLREYLMDYKVMDHPYIIKRWKIDFKILPKRLPAITQAYENIWQEDAAPLVTNSIQLQQKLNQKTDVPVVMAMCFQRPSIQNALQELVDKEVTEVLVIPMYPQYTSSTTWLAVDKVKEVQHRLFKKLNLTFLNSFYNHPDYINALTENIQNQLPEKYDKILFSYTGITKRIDDVEQIRVKNSKDAKLETYQNQCLETTESVRKQLGISEDKVTSSFQAHISNELGIRPYTELIFEDLAKENVKDLVVVSPSHLVDSIDTLDKIENEGKDLFLKNGGENFTYIKCLNDSDTWVEVLAKWIKGWESAED